MQGEGKKLHSAEFCDKRQEQMSQIPMVGRFNDYISTLHGVARVIHCTFWLVVSRRVADLLRASSTLGSFFMIALASEVASSRDRCTSTNFVLFC